MVEHLGKLLMVVGVFVAVLGVLLLFWGKIPFLGHLPGDLFVKKGNFRFLFPLATCLVISALLTFLINIISKVLGK